MTIAQSHRELLLRVNKVASLGNPNLYPFTIDDYLTRAQQILVDKFFPYSKQNNAGFEANTFNIAALSNITVSSPEVQSGIVPLEIITGKYKVNLGDLAFNFVFPTKVEIDVSEIKNGCKTQCTKRIRCDLFQTDDIKNRINQPSFLYGKVHHKFGFSNDNTSIPRYSAVFFDTTDVKEIKQFNIDRVYISYVREPKRVWLGNYDYTYDLKPDSGSNIVPGYEAGVNNPIDLELAEHFHKDIIDIAAQLVINDIKNS